MLIVGVSSNYSTAGSELVGLTFLTVGVFKAKEKYGLQVTEVLFLLPGKFPWDIFNESHPPSWKSVIYGPGNEPGANSGHAASVSAHSPLSGY